MIASFVYGFLLLSLLCIGRLWVSISAKQFKWLFYLSFGVAGLGIIKTNGFMAIIPLIAGVFMATFFLSKNEKLRHFLSEI